MDHHHEIIALAEQHRHDLLDGAAGDRAARAARAARRGGAGLRRWRRSPRSGTTAA